jgi:hypothetical protein
LPRTFLEFTFLLPQKLEASMRGWKTLLLNGGIGAAVVLLEMLTFLGAADWNAILPPDRAAVAVLGIGLANIVLRHVTSGPAGWRKAARP